MFILSMLPITDEPDENQDDDDNNNSTYNDHHGQRGARKIDVIDNFTHEGECLCVAGGLPGGFACEPERL